MVCPLLHQRTDGSQGGALHETSTMHFVRRTFAQRLRELSTCAYRDRRGAGMIEYVILVGAIALLGVAGFTWFGQVSYRRAAQQTLQISALDSSEARPEARGALGTTPLEESEADEGSVLSSGSGAWTLGLILCVGASMAVLLFVRSRQPVKDAIAAGDDANSGLAPGGCAERASLERTWSSEAPEGNAVTSAVDGDSVERRTGRDGIRVGRA